MNDEVVHLLFELRVSNIQENYEYQICFHFEGWWCILLLSKVYLKKQPFFSISTN